MDDPKEHQPDLLQLTRRIAAAYVAGNALSPSAVPDLVKGIHGALLDLLAARASVAPRLEPAVEVGRSVTPKAIICLECGKKFQSLRRHLAAHHDLTPDAYRERWSLPPSYPMVAPRYSATRARIAKDFGLGRKA